MSLLIKIYPISFQSTDKTKINEFNAKLNLHLICIKKFKKKRKEEG